VVALQCYFDRAPIGGTVLPVSGRSSNPVISITGNGRVYWHQKVQQMGDHHAEAFHFSCSGLRLSHCRHCNGCGDERSGVHSGCWLMMVLVGRLHYRPASNHQRAHPPRFENRPRSGRRPSIVLLLNALNVDTWALRGRKPAGAMKRREPRPARRGSNGSCVAGR
jgi:hypothetical protein